MRLPLSLIFALAALTAPALAAEFPTFTMQELDPHVGNVCYAVTTADVNGDGKPDVVAVTEDAVVWFANPKWDKHTIIKNATARDNVCLQAHDIDGDGKIDFALGASWQPTNTKTGGTLQWLKRNDKDIDAPWQVIPIGAEPTLHRIRWGNVLGNGKLQLIVAPLQGRDTKGPNWGEGNGTRILVYSIPENPIKDPWPHEVATDAVHTTHNLQALDFNGDGKDEIVLAGWEGVFLLNRDSDGHWSKTHVGAGNQASSPNKGSSEVKVGKLADGRRYIATVEPWHGFQVVVYTPPQSGKGLWDRRVLDEPLQWGHAVWCADLDGDGDEELIIGQRDKSADPKREPKGPGVFVYDPEPNSKPLAFTRHVIDDGGVGCEDALAADLDGDGRPEIIGGGRSTHNVRIYWNRKPSTPAASVTNSVGMKLVLIPAGDFGMGSPDDDRDASSDEKPQHPVRITQPFYMAATETTQGQYQQAMKTNPSLFKGSDSLPVEAVSWFDAVKFCNVLSAKEDLPPYYEINGEDVKIQGGTGYRLPTEAEWEYACRAGSTTRYSFDDETKIGDYAWFGDNANSTAHPVGLKLPNKWGLHDMHGNVWEWCEDRHDFGYYKELSNLDPKGPNAGDARVLRGGGWGNGATDLRSAVRFRDAPSFRSFLIGLRFVRTYR